MNKTNFLLSGAPTVRAATVSALPAVPGSRPSSPVSALNPYRPGGWRPTGFGPTARGGGREGGVRPWGHLSWGKGRGMQIRNGCSAREGGKDQEYRLSG